MNNKLANKILSVISAFSLLLNTFATPAVVYAQEATESAETESTPTPTPTVTASPSPTPSLESSPEPTLEASPSATPETENEGEVEASRTEATETQNTTESNLPGPDLSETKQDGSAQLDPSLSTDKEDYAPDETVTITGSDFTRNTNLEIRVTWPDDVVRNSAGDEDETDTVLTDDSGDFVFQYDLRGEGQDGEYLVEVLLDATVLATTTFTDSSHVSLPSNVKLEQWETKDAGKWIPGNLGTSNSDYAEGETVPFRLDVSGVSSGAYSFSVCRDYENGTTKGYLFLNPYDTSRSPAVGGTISDTEGNFDAVNVTIDSVNELEAQGSCSAGERETKVEITTTGSTTAYVLWGGHLAAPGDPNVGTGNGAGSYSGSSLHMSLLSPNKDVSINPDAIIQNGSITITKQTLPEDSTQSFDFTLGGDSTDATTLTDDESHTFADLTPGTYTITEDVPDNWELSAVCDGQSYTNGSEISLEEGEDIECTFTNDLQEGSITVLKNVDGNNDGDLEDPEDETGATDWTWDIQDGEQNISTGQTRDLDVGEYTIFEDVKEGYHLVNWECDDNTSGSSNSITINLADNDNITCTFTNAADTGEITLIKSSENDIDPNDWTFDVDGPDDNDFTDVTSGSTLTNLPLGTYTITEDGPNNYHFESGSGTECSFDSDGVLTVVIDGNGDTFECTFTNAPDEGSISGQKYHDKDASSTFNSEIDEVLSGWTIFLDENGNGDLDGEETSTTTDANGDYSFTGLTPDDYVVCEDLQTGWTQISPDPSTNNGCHLVTVEAGQDITNKDFFNFKNITISGFKFEDVDGDGIWDIEESELDGWTINLGGDATDTAVTGDGDWPDGYYEFTNLGPGDYEVSETLISSDWMQTAGDDPYEITAVGGQDVENIDFGNFKLGIVSGFKYNDLNADGDLSDGIELDDWEINLTIDESTTSVLTGTGEWASGYYEFSNLVPGDYTLSETLQLGWNQSFPTSSDYSFVLKSGDVLEFDFGNWTQGDLIACKYDENEEAVFGWDMTVSGNNLQSDVTQSTGENGCTTFELDPGTYLVTEEGKDGWVHTDPVDGDQEATVESDGSVTVDFFNERKADLTIVKFNDEDGDSVDDEEPRLEGWHFTIYEGSCSDKGSEVLAGETDSSGKLTGELESGEYCAVEDDTSHTGWVNTTGLEVDFSLDPDGEEELLFGNQAQGIITIEKDVVPDDESLWEFDIEGPFDYSDSTELGDDDSEEFTGLAAGSYTITEDTSGDYITTFDCGGENTGEGGVATVEVEAGSDITCTFTNTIKRGSITIVKETDPEFTEEQFDFEIDGDNEFSDSLTIFGSGTDTFDELQPGEYILREIIPEGWNLTAVSCTDEEDFENTGVVTVSPDEEVTCTFENTQQVLGLSIEKTNDSPTTSAGAVVTYTLTVTNEGNTAITGIDFIDVLPGGFTYVAGSTTGETTADPTISGGKLTWEDAASLLPGDSATISYEAEIASDASEATYTNIATCIGESRVLVLEEGDLINGEIRGEEVECDTVTSDVTISTDVDLSASLSPQVLGAQTEVLPAAGNDTTLLYIFLGMIVGGLSLRVVAQDLEKKEKKNA